MPIVFPSNPTPNQTYSTGSSAIYTWNGFYWDIVNPPSIEVSSAISSSYTVSSSITQPPTVAPAVVSSLVPSSPLESGSLWWNNNNGDLYIQVSEPSGSTYVSAVRTAVSVVSASFSTTASIATDYNWVNGGTVLVDATASSPTKGVTVYDTVRYRKINSDTYEVDYNLGMSSAGTTGTGVYLWRLPSGLTWGPGVLTTYPDTTENQVNRALITQGQYYNSTEESLVAVVPYDSSRFFVLVSDDSYEATVISSTNLSFSTPNFSIKFSFYTTI